MKKFIKNNIVGFIIGILLTSVTVYAANEILFSSSQISFDNSRAQLKNSHGDDVETIEEAIEALENRGSCPAGYQEVNLGYSVICRNTIAPICKRAQAGTLHTETCNYTSGTSYCYADGYYVGGTRNTTTVTYGRIGVTGQNPVVGDAFDCDVNGDGIYNSITERFYYVSDYFDTNTETFDNNYAALIYYKNTQGGVPNDDAAPYYGTSSAFDNWHGPTTAITHLPSTTGENAWRTDLLKTDNRRILACNEYNCTELSDSTAGGTIVQTNRIYAGKAARLIHLKEIKNGCTTNLGATKSLSNECNFFMENTKYTESSKPTYGPWSENPSSADAVYASGVGGNLRRVLGGNTYITDRGARPVIDVRYADIAY